MTLTTSADAGWYHDPSDSGAWRWWDGATWTEHVRPKEPTAPIEVVAAEQQYVTPPAQPVLQPLVEPNAEPPTISAPQAIYTAPVSTAFETPAFETPAPAATVAPVAPVAPVAVTPLTPSTPASEQLYWHSAAAEVVEVPGRTTSSLHADPRRMSFESSAHEVRIWGDAGSPHTVGIWLLALLPIISVILTPVVGLAIGATIQTINLDDPLRTLQSVGAIVIGYSLFLVVLSWIFAGNDAKSLRLRGYAAPKIWWMLLPLSPLAYFIARGKAVRAEGKRAWPPELLYFMSIMIPIGLGVVGAIFSANFAGLLGLSGLGI